MPADDRDAKFERALAHHLRGDSAAACPDAETLAAYHKRSLSLEEMAHWKQHISGCAACQETLTLVETTEKQFAEDWEEKQIPVLEAAAQRPVAARSIAGRSQEAPGEKALVEEASAGKSPVEISRRRRPLLLRWAVPLGAVAAGVLVWIGIHEQRVLTRQAESVQVARNQPSPAPVQMAQNQPAPAPEQKLNDALRSVQPMERDDRQAQLNEEATRKRADSSVVVSQLAASAKPEAGAKDAELAKKEAGGRTSDALAYKTAPAPPPAVHAQAPAKAPASNTESVEVSATAPPAAPAPAPAVTGGVGSGVGGGMGAVDEKSARARKEKALPNNQQAAANNLDTTTNAMMEKQDALSQRVIIPLPIVNFIDAPDIRVRWRLRSNSPAGTVELSTDAGKTWSLVNTGTSSQLLSGSAPSSRVCWIVGQGGVLLLTKDQGRHWKILTTPLAGELNGVQAADAKHASIWDTNHHLYYTSDGGSTWK